MSGFDVGSFLLAVAGVLIVPPRDRSAMTAPPAAYLSKELALDGAIPTYAGWQRERIQA